MVWILVVLAFVTVGDDIVAARPVPLGEFQTQELCEAQRVKVLQDPEAKDSYDRHLAAIGCMIREKK